MATPRGRRKRRGRGRGRWRTLTEAAATKTERKRKRDVEKLRVVEEQMRREQKRLDREFEAGIVENAGLRDLETVKEGAD